MPARRALPPNMNEFSFNEPSFRFDQLDHCFAAQAIRFTVGQLSAGPGLALLPDPRREVRALNPEMPPRVARVRRAGGQPVAQGAFRQIQLLPQFGKRVEHGQQAGRANNDEVG